MLDKKFSPFHLRQFFDAYNFMAQEFGDIRYDIQFLKSFTKAITPGLSSRSNDIPTDIFPDFKFEPHPVLAGKRIGLIASGGSGSLVTLCGIKRAFEEADIEVEAMSVCSGGAIWGSMMAIGMSAQEMVDACFGWTPADVIDMDWASIAKIPLNMGRGFGGFIKGDALEDTLERTLKGTLLSEAKVPYYANVLNIDLNKVEYFGPHNRPDEKLSKMVRTAISLPLFLKPVKFDDHYYVDGGVVNIFPVEPLLRYEKPFDYFFGVNAILPPGFDGGVDITGWLEEPASIIIESRQLRYMQHIEMASQQYEKIKDKTILLEPVPCTEIEGAKFYGVFLDNSTWPEYVSRAYVDTKEKLKNFKG